MTSVLSYSLSSMPVLSAVQTHNIVPVGVPSTALSPSLLDDRSPVFLFSTYTSCPLSNPKERTFSERRGGGEGGIEKRRDSGDVVQCKTLVQYAAQCANSSNTHTLDTHTCTLAPTPILLSFTITTISNERCLAFCTLQKDAFFP